MRVALVLIVVSLLEWAQGYKEGTSFAQYGVYQQMYEATRDRDFVVMREKVEGDAILVEYLASWTNMETDARESEHGYAAFYLKDGQIYTEEHAVVSVDMALAGQVADIGSTAIALTQGFVEGNPIGSTPAGLAALVLAKLAAPSIADRLDLQDCVVSRQFLSGFGWGAATWNLALVAGVAPVVGIVGGVIAASQSMERQPALAACLRSKLDRG